MTSSGIRIRLIFLACLVGIAFLLVFKPIRLARSQPAAVLEDSFTYELGQPVVELGEDRETRLSEKRDELLGRLREANPTDPEWVEAVVTVDVPTQLRVDTVILPGLQADEQSEEYRTLAQETLKKDYPRIEYVPPKRGEEDEAAEDAVASFWRFNIYNPVPHINLGLDLRGGLHLVLQCLPSTTYPFTADEENPLLSLESTASEFELESAQLQQTLKDELQAAFEMQEARFSFVAGQDRPFLNPDLPADEFEIETPDLEQELRDEIVAAFEGSDLPVPWRLVVNVTSPTDMQISTVAATPKQAEQRGQVLLACAEERFPGIRMSVSELAPLLAPRRLVVNVVGPTEMEISTVTESAEDAQAHEQVVTEYLAARYPGIEMGEPERLLLERDTAEKVRNIVERRVNALGVAESTIEIQGRDRLIVEIPGTKTAERVERIVDSRALLEFRLVPEEYKLDESRQFTRGESRIWRLGDPETGEIVSEKQVMARSSREVLGRDLKPESAVLRDPDSPAYWAVRFELKNDRQQRFHAMTRTSVGQYLVILLDGKVQMAPVIRSAMMGAGIITGQFSDQEAKELALLLNGGALPVPIEIVENRTVSATLGEDSISKSARAGIIGLVLVVCFMVLWYRAPGLIADVALMVYVLLVLGVYSFIDAVLTLPGIAGFILSIGMAVDANIIIFERLKEELATAKTMRSAVEAGFNRAWTAILDANVTTLIVAAVLYYFGTGPIRGFAVVLAIGVSCSLFTAITATRWMITLATTSGLGGNRWLFGTGLGGSPDDAE